METPIADVAEAMVTAAEQMAAAAGYDQCEGVSNILLSALFFHAAKHIRDPDALRSQLAAAADALCDMADTAAEMSH